jgi:predicted O-methyltransferase YrrM
VLRVARSLLKSLSLPKPLRRLVAELVIADRERRGSELVDVRSWPERIDGFEDLAFLFSSTILAHGVASLRFDEAAYLYRLVRESKPQTVVEIGRFRGGSTFLIACALTDGIVHSYDLDQRQGHSGADLDAQLTTALRRYALLDRVRLYVADSRSAPPPGPRIDLLFIDGDHREEGVRADFERWSRWLAPGGHLLFHDAVEAPDFVQPHADGPARVAARLGEGFEQRGGAGSLAHFTRSS